MNSNRLKITTWVGFADFFTTISLFMFSHYAVQRHKVILIGKPVKDFAAELHNQLASSHVKHQWDQRQSWLTLPDDFFLFEKNSWQIRDPKKVELLANALKAALHKTQSDGGPRPESAFRFYLMIRGHADARPTTGITNMELSKRRARSLEEALVQYDVCAPEFQVSSQGVGETEPVVDNCAQGAVVGGHTSLLHPCTGGRYASDQQLSINRRIELRFGVFAAK
jgi:outer membrane protein OmpA-like peptidoglycan-associated protein